MTAFQGARGETQGYLLSPTIFNMVVGTVVQHWVMVVVEGGLVSTLLSMLAPLLRALTQTHHR